MRTLLISLILTAASAFAADIDGKWSGAAETGTGPTPVAYTLKADGVKLTGTMTAPDGSERELLEGKIDGNKLSFKVIIDVNGMPLSFTFTGEVAGADLKLVTDFGGMPISVTAKKA
jgi:hypothetical protein